MTQPEFSRTMRIDTIGTAPRAVHIKAGAEERAALARRFNIIALERLEAEVEIHRANQDIVSTGRLSADVVQSCVATAAPLPASITEAFTITFRAEPDATTGEEEVELGEGELDVMFYDGAMIDVGEAVSQTLALNLPPYPRAPEAGDALEEAGVIDEAAAGPLGALAAALKEKLGK
jgi:uncharacterized metal-binding protein YceD (DUF177 family)